MAILDKIVGSEKYRLKSKQIKADTKRAKYDMKVKQTRQKAIQSAVRSAAGAVASIAAARTSNASNMIAQQIGQYTVNDNSQGSSNVQDVSGSTARER